MKAVLALTLIVSVCAIGSQTPEFLVASASVALVALVFAARSSTVAPRKVASLVLFAGIFCVAATLFQLVPLPPTLLRALAPHNAEVWARAAESVGKPIGFAPLSLSPVETREEVLRGLFYIAVFVVSHRVAMRKSGTLFIERVLFLTGILLSLSYFLHPALGLEKVFGLYRPLHFRGSGVVGPLLNSNHLAAYLNVALLIGVFSMGQKERLLPRSLLLVALIFLFGTSVRVASRGGTLSLLVGLVVIGGFWWSRRRDLLGATPLMATILLGAGIVLYVTSSSQAAFEDLSSRDVGKLAFFRKAATMIPAYGVFGTGRGAFESTFPEFRTGSGYDTYTHPENLLLQWGIEWGLPATLCLAVLLGFALRPQTVLARSEPPIGAYAVLVCALVHNLVDFGSEVPGIVAAYAACAGIIVSGAAAPGERWGWWCRRGAGFAAVPVLLVATVVVWLSRGQSLAAEQGALLEASSAQLPEAAFEGKYVPALMRHPAEPYLPFCRAMHAARARPDRVLYWLGRTLERAPVYPPAHLFLARQLAVRSASHARMEYRVSVEQFAGYAGTVAKEAVPLISVEEDAMAVVPGTPAALAVLEALALHLPDTRRDVRARVDREILLRQEHHEAALLRLLEDAARDLETGSPRCAGDACVREAEGYFTRVTKLETRKSEGPRLYARVLRAANRESDAMAMLSRACTSVSDVGACFVALAELAIVLRDDARTTEAIERVLRAGCSEDGECVENLLRISDLEHQRGYARSALVYLRRALARAPERDDIRRRVADRARAVGLHAEALEEYGRLQKKFPHDETLRGLVAEEKEAVMRSALPR